MTDMSPITPAGVTEDAYFTHSPVSARFSRALVALGAAIESERDIEYGRWSDPAFAGLLRHAELCWEETKMACAAVLGVPQVRVSDVPLQKMARHISDTLDCETAIDLRCMMGLLRAHPKLFSFSGADAVSLRAGQMLERARLYYADLCALEMMPEDEPYGFAYAFSDTSYLPSAF